jgi:hypothetical protein
LFRSARKLILAFARAILDWIRCHYGFCYTGCAKDQCQGLIAMDETLKDPDQNEDDILVFEVSDDALEASAGPVGAFPTDSIDIIPPNCC